MSDAESLTILHIAAPARVGGLERVVQALCTGHCRTGHRVHALLVLDESELDHPLIQSLRDGGVVVHPLAIPTRAYGRERAGVRDLCRRLHPHAVHTHGYRPDVVDGGVARWRGVPQVTTVHGFIRGGGRGRLYEWLQRRSYRRADAVVAVSQPLVTELEGSGVPAERIHLVANAWGPLSDLLPPAEARARLAIPEGIFHIGWVGRLSREKGADVLLEAVALLEDLPIGVSFIGGGRDESGLRARARALGIEARVHWHGMMPDAAPFYPAFGAFVLSSRTEGTPIALFEAMHAGVPIVAARVGGVPDVVSTDEALLVAPERPDELAAALRTIHRDRTAAETRARAAAARLETHFGIQPWLDRYETIYRQLQQNRKPAR